MSEYTLTHDIRELTFSELDQVSGGAAAVSADLVGDAIVNGSFHLDGGQPPDFPAIASISGTMTVFSGSPTLTLTAVATSP